VLAYDAARQACVALLAQQGLRPTTAGGHYAVEEIIRASSARPCGPSAACAAGATSWSTRSTRPSRQPRPRQPKRSLPPPRSLTPPLNSSPT
jgi:phage tail tape-measure protein